MRVAWSGLIVGALGGCGSTDAVDTTESALGDTSLCRPVDGTEPAIELSGQPLPLACKGVYVDPAMTPAQRKQLEAWYTSSIRAIATVFGDAMPEPPTLVQCVSEACILHFSPDGRAHATMNPPTIYVNGMGQLAPGTITHEMVHIAIGLKAKQGTGAAVPEWFDEGVATYLGDNADCAPGMSPAIDDLRRLARGWYAYTSLPGRIHLAYCQARAEIAAWVSQHGRPALVEVIDAVHRGTPFEEAYGPLMIAPTAAERVLDAEIPLDESFGSTALDHTGRSHAVSVNASWAPGHRGFGVDVSGGRHVRVDGLLDLGLPNMPFSVSLWTKPRAGSRVLVHSAVDAESAKGFCLPVLGQDEAGQLVAQVNYGGAPDTFLVAKAAALPQGEWSHVAMTWDPKEGVSIWVNGSLAANRRPTSAAQAQRVAPATNLRLFFGSDLGAQCWRGALPKGNWEGGLDEIRVHSYALTANELADLAR